MKHHAHQTPQSRPPRIPSEPWRSDHSSQQRPGETEAEIQRVRSTLQPLLDEMGRIIVGQQGLVDRLVVSLLTGGHVLLEGLPGLAKTLTVKTLAGATHGTFKRLQFTPDMLPADIVGTLVYSPQDSQFHTRRGPVFANFVLADEVNRAPAKVQSALLEAMEERQVTIGDESHGLPNPFLVLATQNPVDQEGTYALPEAQLDRFLMKLHVGYPSATDEREILDRMASSVGQPQAQPVIDLEAIEWARDIVDNVYMDDRIRDYIVDLIQCTRDPEAYGIELGSCIRFGASPRGTIGLTRAAKAWAALSGRAYVSPGDVRALAPDVLRHRIGLTYEGIAQGLTADEVVATVLATVPTP